jgi:hypothetical protein
MNRGADSIVSVYSDARAEYTKQLCVFLVPAYFQFFTELLEKAKQTMVNEPKKILWQFQNYLNEIHDWNIQKVTSEIHTIHTNSGCDYLEDLLTAVFIAHTKVLTAIRLSSNNKKVEINIPKVEHFLFKVLCETSKLLWSSTYLFRDGIPGIEKQQNYRMIEQLINEGILQAIRGLVPVKSILKDFINNDSVGDDEESDEEVEPDTNEANNQKKEVVSQPLSSSINDTLPVHDSRSNDTHDLTSNIVLPSSEVEDVKLMNEVKAIEEMKPVEVIKPVEETTQSEQGTNTEEIKNNSLNQNTVNQNTVNQNTVNQNTVNPENQTIIIDEKPGVRFGQFDTVFDLDHPMDSDLIYEPKDTDNEVPALEILDEQGIPLSDELDIDRLDDNKEGPEDLGIGDYEEL